jgi:hypothetical protein
MAMHLAPEHDDDFDFKELKPLSLLAQTIPNRRGTLGVAASRPGRWATDPEIPLRTVIVGKTR